MAEVDGKALDGFPWSSEARVVEALEGSSLFVPEYVKWASGQIDAPLAYHVVSALAVLSVTVPPHLVLPGLPGGAIYPNLYCMVVGRQGTDRKTTAMNLAMRLLAESAPGKLGGDPGSAQGLLTSLAETPQQLVYYSDLSDLYARTQSHSGGNAIGDIKTKLLTVFDCAPQSKVLSKKAKTIRIEQPRLSLLGGINPALVAAHVEPRDFDGGLFSRHLVAYARRERTLYKAADTPKLRAWLVNFLTGAAAMEPNSFGPCVGLNDEAFAIWREWSERVELAIPTGPDARVVGPQARAPLMAAKIAFLLAFGTGAAFHGEPWEIRLADMVAAIRLATISYRSALVLGATTEGSRDMRHRRQVLDVVGTDWTVFAEILRNARLLKRRCQEILESLEAEGTIRRLQVAGEPHPYYQRTDLATSADGDVGDDHVTAAERAFADSGLDIDTPRPVADAPPPAPPTPRPPPSLSDVLRDLGERGEVAGGSGFVPGGSGGVRLRLDFGTEGAKGGA